MPARSTGGRRQRSALTGRFVPARRTFRISSRATGERRFVTVHVYDEQEAMLRDAERYNGHEHDPRVAAVTQGFTRISIAADGSETARYTPIVRLHRGALGTAVIVHELNHAAVGIYGSTLHGDELAADLLDHANETLAYLASDLTWKLVDLLYGAGYFGSSS